MNKLSPEDAVNCVKLFIELYELWEDSESRRKYNRLKPNYESLGMKYYEAYMNAKDYGF